MIRLDAEQLEHCLRMSSRVALRIAGLTMWAGQDRAERGLHGGVGLVHQGPRALAQFRREARELGLLFALELRENLEPRAAARRFVFVPRRWARSGAAWARMPQEP